MTYYFLYKTPGNTKRKLEVDADNQEEAMNTFVKLFPQFTVYHVIPIPEWK